MKNLKRALSFALASVMVLGMMVVGAGAAEFKDADKIENVDAVNTMTALGVLKGKDTGNFDPEGIVTRAEMAKIICVMLSGGTEPNLGTSAPAYPDTANHWANSFISYCSNMGIVAGDNHGNFNPDKTVTGTEAAKMLLVALGYDSDVFGFTGATWAIKVNTLATQIKMYEDVDTSADAGLSRDNAAQMAFNALDLKLMKKTYDKVLSNGEISYTYIEDDDDFLKKYFDATIGLGYMVDAEYDEGKKEYTYTIDKAADFGAGAITTDGVDVTLKTTEDYSFLYGRQVKALYKNNKEKTVFGIVANDSEILYSGIIADIPDDLKTTDSSVKLDGTSYKFDGDASDVYFWANLSGQYTTPKIDMAGLTDLPLEYAFDLIDNDDNGKADCAIVYPFAVAKVSYVGTDSFNLKDSDSFLAPDSKTGIKFDEVIAYEDMAKNDYVRIVESAFTLTDKTTYEKIESSSIVEGKVTATKTDAIKVDGEWYNHDGQDLTLGSTYKMVVVNGYICLSETVTAGAEVGDYALVTRATDEDAWNPTRAELLYADGTKKVVETDADYSSLKDKLVTVDTEDGKYVLTAALANGDDAEEAGFDAILDESVDYVYANGGKSTMAGETIADDAVIFTVNVAGDKHKVITGSALKKYATDSVTDLHNVYANTASTGFKTVALAFVTVKNSVTTSTENYGYVTSGLTTTKNDDGETVSILSFWTADGQVNDAEADTRLNNVAKGSVITYTLNGDGTYAIDRADVNRGAVLAYNDRTGAIRFTDGTLKDGAGNVDKEVASDTVILAVNSDSKKGMEGPEISTAVETDTDDLYYANAYWFASAGTELDVIIIDTYAKFPVLPGTASLSGAIDDAALQLALSSNKSVTLDASGIDADVSATLPEGNTLKVTAVDDTKKLTITVEKDATLDLSALDSASTDDMLEVTLKPGAILKADVTLFGAGGYLNSTADVTIKNDGNLLKVAATSGTITVEKDLTVAATSHTFALSGATIKGADYGVELVIVDATDFTGQDSSNFFADTANAVADAVEAATYKWTEKTGSLTADGWVKQ